jgi:hypothetical protein
MKKVFAVITMLLVSASPIFAQSIGVGWEDGASVRIPASKVTIQGILNFSNLSAQKNSNIAEGTSFDLAAYVAYPLLTMDKSDLNFFGGVGMVHNPDQDLSVGFRFGIEPVVMVTNHFGVSGKLGLQFISIGGAKNADDTGGSLFGLYGITAVHWFF